MGVFASRRFFYVFFLLFGVCLFRVVVLFSFWGAVGSGSRLRKVLTMMRRDPEQALSGVCLESLLERANKKRILGFERLF